MHGKPVELKTGKIIATKSGRMVRVYCPACFFQDYVPEKKR
jgi:hypothetical protein